MMPRGGVRKDAGRPRKSPESKYVRLNGVTLPPEIAAWLQGQRAEGETTSEALARLLRSIKERGDDLPTV